MIGFVVTDILLNTASVTDVVGNRIYPSVIPQDEPYPAITFLEVAVNPSGTKDGPSELDQINVQINCFASTNKEASELAQKVRTALDYRLGNFQGVEVDKIVFKNQSDQFDDDLLIHHKAIDFSFRIKK